MTRAKNVQSFCFQTSKCRSGYYNIQCEEKVAFGWLECVFPNMMTEEEISEAIYQLFQEKPKTEAIIFTSCNGKNVILKREKEVDREKILEEIRKN